MLKFRNLLAFPSILSKRQKSINLVTLNNLEFNKESNLFIITGIANNKYKPVIHIIDNYKSMDAYVKIKCNCQSFNYEFANAINRSGSLLDPNSFNLAILNKPLTKNKTLTPSPCKHVITLANFALRRNFMLH